MFFYTLGHLVFILASKLSELEKFENFAANDQFRKQNNITTSPNPETPFESQHHNIT